MNVWIGIAIGAVGAWLLACQLAFAIYCMVRACDMPTSGEHERRRIQRFTARCIILARTEGRKGWVKSR